MLVVTFFFALDVAVVAYRWVGNVRKTSEVQVKFTISAVLPSLIRSRGEYLRVVGIHSDD